MKRLLTILTAITLFCCIGRAQQFPVQVTPQLLPPYSVQISDYYSPGAAGTKLNLLLLLRDFNKPQLQVRLRMSIEGQSVSIRTREDAVFTPITIESGTPKYIDPADLAQYFNPNNLDFSGITRQQYEQTGKLPEGFYTFCFEAIEVSTNQSVSNKGCTFAWITLNEPPILNIPRKAEAVIPATPPQDIIFQWTPRHTASPTAAFTTDYTFSIVEMAADDISPEAAFISRTPLRTELVTTTTVSYSPDYLGLSPDKKYAWRVQAKAKNGTQDLATFRNQGYSETFWFIYQNNCVAPGIPTASPQGQRVTIEWPANPLHLEYKVEYRETNDADAQWFEIGNTLPRVSIGDLTPGKAYEYRVGGACEYGRFTFGNLYPFTANDSNATTVPNCGQDPNLTDPPQNFVQTLPVGDTIFAGDYDVIVTDIQGVESFSGEGHVKISWLGNIDVAVRFTNIKVNSEKRLALGEIETTYDPTEGGIADVDAIIGAFTGGYEVGRVVTGVDTADHVIDFVIQMPNGISITPGEGYNSQTGQGPVTINLTPVGGGAVQTIEVTELPTTIKDKDGNIYQVNKDGSVTALGKSGGDQFFNTTNRTHVDTDKAVVVFKDYPEKQVYAFDEWKEVYKKSSAFNKKYERLNNDYYVSAKAIAQGKTDYLKAVIRLKDNTLTPDSIQFVNSKGTIYNKTLLNDSTFEISVVGGPEKDAQEIYALYPRSGSKTFNLGKVLVASYPQKEYKVKLVPVNGTPVNADAVKGFLLTTYKGLNIHFDVSIGEPFTNNSWDKDGDGNLDVIGSGVLSSYTEEMKTLMETYSSTNPIDLNTVYLFVLKNSNGQNIGGDMPRGTKYGYIFTDSSTNVPQTVAHEIAHGIFQLKHTFEYKFSPSDLPENLLNYYGGFALTKYQWDLIHDAGVVFRLFDGDKDQLNIIASGNKLDPQLLTNNRYYSFITPSGKRVFLDSSIKKPVFFHGIEKLRYSNILTGSLVGFTDKDGNEYNAIYDNSGFIGYKKLGASEYANINSYPFFKETDAVIQNEFVLYLPDCKDKGAIVKFSGNGISNYNGGTDVNILSEKEFPKIYSTDYIVLHKQSRKENLENSTLLLDGQTNITPGELRMINYYCSTEEFLPVLKVAQLSNMYPLYFKQFTARWHNWSLSSIEQVETTGGTPEQGNTITNSDIGYWEKHLLSNEPLRAKWNSGNPAERFEFYSIMMDSLIAFYARCENANQNFINSISESLEIFKIRTGIDNLSDVELGNISIDKRIILLRRLAATDLGEVDEKRVLRLIRFIPDTDLSGLFYGLKKDNLLFTLFDKIHDAVLGVGGNNFTNLAVELNKLFSRKYKNDLKQNGLNVDAKKTFKWDPEEYFKFKNTNEANPINIRYLENGKIELSQQRSIWIEDGWYPTFDKTYTDTIDALDVVNIYFKDPLSQDIFPSSIPANSTIPVPGYFLAWLVQKQHSDQTLRLAFGAIDIINVFSGATELKLAKNGIRFTIGLIQVFSGASHIALIATDAKERIKSQYGENSAAYRAVSYYSKLVEVADIAVFSYSILQIGKNFLKNFDEAKTGLTNDPLYSALTSKADEIKNLLIASGETFVASDNVASALSQYPHLIDLINNAGNSRAALLIHINSWDEQSGLRTLLNNRLAQFSDGASTLKNQLIASPELMSTFQKINENWWQRLLARRKVIQGSITGRFADMINDMPIFNYTPNNKLGAISVMEEIPSGISLGNYFDAEMERLIRAWWLNGTEVDLLPPAILNKLQELRIDGYVLFTKPKVSIGGRTPEPDLLFIKQYGSILDFDDCIYIDNKYYIGLNADETPKISWTDPQKEIINSFAFSPFAEVKATAQFASEDGNFLIPINQTLKINKVQAFGINDDLLLKTFPVK